MGVGGYMKLVDLGKRHFYIAYSLFFCLMATICFSWFIFNDRSLIWQGDGWQQHFKALVYYGQYLRQIFRVLITEHRLVIPDWDFYIGEGSDIINTLHYYVIGDPVAFLSVFVPTKYMHYFYTFSCLLRIYLAGISFSLLCFGTGRRSKAAVFGGTIAYCFCKWALTSAGTHPYFLNPLIYFPLMILGTEKIIRKEKPHLFIVISAISAISNFYFFYMIALLTAAYAVIRLILLYKKDLKAIFADILRIAVFALTGCAIAGVMIIPVFMMLMGDERLGYSQPFHWLYPRDYYSRLPYIILNSSQYELHIGLTAMAVVAVFLLFIRKKEDLLLKVLVIAQGLIILFPIGGRILNGFSYMTNRWSFAIALLVAYILVKKWYEMANLSREEWKKLGICLTSFLALCVIFEKSRQAAAFSVVALVFITWIVLSKDLKTAGRRLQVIMICLSAAGCILNSFWQFSSQARNFAEQTRENRQVRREWDDNELSVLEEGTGDNYNRISGTFLTRNANIFKRISSTQYYWSMSNPYLGRFRNDLYLREPQLYFYEGYDDRTSLVELSSVREYVTDGSGIIPYGFEQTDQTHSEALNRENLYYTNEYALPLGYCYDTYLTKEKWDELNPVQKQEVQLRAAYVDSAPEGMTAFDMDMPDYLLSYEASCEGEDITTAEGRITTTAPEQQLEIAITQGVANAELYVSIKGLEFIPVSEYALYFGDDTVDPMALYDKEAWDSLSAEKQKKITGRHKYWNSVKDTKVTAESFGGKKVIEYMQPDSPMSCGRHDFIANLGYTEDPVSSVTLTFSERGIYTYESLSIYAVPMEGYAEKTAALKADCLENLHMGTDEVTGTIALEQPKLLCLAIPFSKGWKAYVDGGRENVFCLNERYLGILIPAGDHTVTLRYSTPYKKAGALVSVLGIFTFLIIIYIYRKPKAPGKND